MYIDEAGRHDPTLCVDLGATAKPLNGLRVAVTLYRRNPVVCNSDIRAKARRAAAVDYVTVADHQIVDSHRQGQWKCESHQCIGSATLLPSVALKRRRNGLQSSFRVGCIER
jgi:hypothetical protein